MIKILFVCHGNICRSPMAEFVLKDMVQKQNMEGSFFIASAATSTEDIGTPVHRGTRKKLSQYGISTNGKYAVKLEKNDYDKYDYIIGMDSYNIEDILNIVGGDVKNKVSKLLNFSNTPRDIRDPWYTGDFDETYNDVLAGCTAFLNYVKKHDL